jgi:imidazolonepropionase-like amidohydrolase
MSRTILINADLLDGERPLQANVAIALSGERVLEIGKAVEIRPDDRVIDLSGHTVMPGMVSGHYHGPLHEVGAPNEASSDSDAISQSYRALSNAQLALRRGYTSVISASTHSAFNIDVKLSELIEAGTFVGPRLIPAEKPIIAGSVGPGLGEDARFCEHARDFEKAVTEEIELGAKIIKIFASGGHGVGVPRDITFEELRIICGLARDNGARVRAHVTGPEKMLECIEAGVAILDHADGLNDECIAACVENDTFILPSLLLPFKSVELAAYVWGFNDLSDFRVMCDVLPKADEAGVNIVTGDDYGVWPLKHGDYSDELPCYVLNADIGPLTVIRWATKNGGRMTGIRDLGTLQPGRIADLIVVKGNPADDISILTIPERIVSVFKSGALVSGAVPVQ